MERIEPSNIVKIKFTMVSHLPDGTVKQRPRETIDFFYKIEPQVPTLEKALDGARVGDKFKLTIPSSEMYGEHDPVLIKEIPKKGLIKQRIKEGQYYRQMRKGSLVSFKILEERPDTVMVDFNKPMAGIWVEMDVEVMDIRKASDEEIKVARENQAKRDIGCG